MSAVRRVLCPWQHWRSRVLGTDAEIKFVVERAKTCPKTSQEVQELIIKKRGEEVNKTIEDSKRSFY